MAQTILIADDEQGILDVLQYNLEKGGYAVVCACDGLEAMRLAHTHAPDLAVLDITMPGMDGLELCGRLRLELNMPVILLTARDSELDKIVGLEIGADDYVTKPFSPREVLARVKAVLRRAKTGGEPAQTSRLHSGPLCLDTLRHEVFLSDARVALTAKEFSLLEYLMRNAGIALTRHAILDHVWGYDFYGDARTVDVHIRRLREKVEPDPAAPSLILTVPGIGYKFTTGS
ncbi:MAG TPA: response regulator transcription factor [Armatimonadota bacterium]|nr:response regulator transcription factor [Armatimonadota bacterium]